MIDEKIGQCDYEAQYITHPFLASVELIVVCRRHGEIASQVEQNINKLSEEGGEWQK